MIIKSDFDPTKLAASRDRLAYELRPDIATRTAQYAGKLAARFGNSLSDHQLSEFMANYQANELATAVSLARTALRRTALASSYALKNGNPRIRRLNVSNDVDANLVPWGGQAETEARTDLRTGHVPALRAIEYHLAEADAGIALAVCLHSDRPESVLSKEGTELLAGEIGIFNEGGLLDTSRLWSSKDGPLVRDLPEELRVQHYAGAITEEVTRARVNAVSGIMSADAVRNHDGYHDKVAAYNTVVAGESADLSEVWIATDDIKSVSLAAESSRFEALWTRGTWNVSAEAQAANPDAYITQPMYPDDEQMWTR